jgi:hypothetical protein
MCIFVLCLIVVSLSVGKSPFEVKKIITIIIIHVADCFPASFSLVKS